MSNGWTPRTFEEACRRHAGRRKLHRRKRKARAERIVRLLGAIDGSNAVELRESARAWLALVAQVMQVSKATASRDLALVRRLHRQFVRMFGRNFDPKIDRIVWFWNFDFYGFVAPESKRAGYSKPVGRFPFDTRKLETEESYQGFTQLSWRNGHFIAQMSTRDLMRTLSWSYKVLNR